jgi:UDP-N-acetylmuramate dehydrogenase
MTLNIRENFPLSSVCTFGIGGPAKYFALVKNLDELKESLEFAQENKLKPFIYGGGSNLLFPDEGLSTLVIKIAFKSITHSDYPTPKNLNTKALKCDAGVSWIEIARYCSQHSLYGLEGLYGLPGTVGGAVYGNAGCHQQETSDVLITATLFDSTSQQILKHQQKDFNFTYRYSNLKENKHLLVLSAVFLVSSDPNHKHGDPNTYSLERKEKQPNGLTTGSFFKNPPSHFAGQLIEQAGLKGFKIGGIQVSDKHANFFINTGTATAKDVIALQHHIQDTVLAKFNIQLEPEVQIVESQDWKS